MNIILLTDKQWDDATETHEGRIVCLDPRQSLHCRKILHTQPGDSIAVGMINGKCGKAVVESLSPSPEKNQSVFILIKQGALDSAPPNPQNLTLYLALARPKMLRRMLQVSAELGVKQIHLFNSAKVDKSYWQSPLLSEEKIEQTLLAGLEQSKDTTLPAIYQHKLFRPFVEDQLKLLINGNPAWVAHPYAPNYDLRDVKQKFSATAPTHIFIGPEGGFNTFETEALQKAGAQLFSAGDRIMRCETFLPWLLGALNN